jgi:hypothetical protein
MGSNVCYKSQGTMKKLGGNKDKKDSKDQNIPKHIISKIKFIMNSLQPTTSFPYCFLRGNV